MHKRPKGGWDKLVEKVIGDLQAITAQHRREVAKLVAARRRRMSEPLRKKISIAVRAGLRKARARGKRLGRPPGSSISASKVRKLRKDGLSQKQIALALDVSQATVSRCLKAKLPRRTKV